MLRILPGALEEGQMKREKKRVHAQGAKWRKLDNTAKLFAAVAGEDFGQVFRISAALEDEVSPELLKQALDTTLPEFENFRVKLRKGFFWNYFETNNRDPVVEHEETYPCKFIDPHVSGRFPFRVSFYGRRINFEVFHGLTDGLGALNFMKYLTERYLELAAGEQYKKERESGEGQAGLSGGKRHAPGEAKEAADRTPPAGRGHAAFSGQRTRQEADRRIRERAVSADSYLTYYRERPHKRYETERALAVTGDCLPLDWQSVLHGTVALDDIRALGKHAGVSITKYLAAALLWSVIQVYTDGRTLKRPAALNLPINLRTFFESDTMANFFSVVNISWPAGPAPRDFEELLGHVSRQMDEKIVKDKLEETISYNVSNEKKWYVRIIPLWIKNIALSAIFFKTSRAYTMTLSNLGPVALREDLAGMVRGFQLLLGVSGRQRMKCGVIACNGKLCITFNSAMEDMDLQDCFFRFLREKGVEAELESNGVADREHDQGNYPSVSHDRGKLKKIVNLFYLALLTAAALMGITNYAAYGCLNRGWSLLVMGGIAYAAMTVRYSVMRRANIAGILVRQSLGAQALLVLIDYMYGMKGWSVNYAIPCLILFDVIAIVFLILLNRLNWQSYFMYQIAITVFSFIPLFLWWGGLITKPLLSVIVVILSVAVLAGTVILGDWSIKKELKRRFYF